MFSYGWKFNMFNETILQSNKAIAAITVIFAQLIFSLSSIQVCNEHMSYSLVVLTYCMICMFSFFNVTYVRDFDALQVNFTPILLTICGIVALQRQYDIFLLGMVLSLAADSYFAIRFKDNTDKIKFTMVERFAMESWTQEAFNKAGRLTLQIASVCIISLQLYLTIVGAHNKEKLSFLFLAFYLVRLVQFIFKTSLAVQMSQSNFMCICLAVVGVLAITSQSAMSLPAKLSIGLQCADALIGTAIFVNLNQEEIYKELGVHKEYKMKQLKGLNQVGHISNLKVATIDTQQVESI
jgi:hypothetical protein